jgi:alpha-N-acetylglucosaminidase
MKHLFISLIALFLTIGSFAQSNDVVEAQNLAARLSPRLAEKVVFQKIKSPQKGCDAFSIQNKGDKVLIGGNNANSMAVGLNRYLKEYCHTTVSWYADVPVELPAVLPQVDRDETITARVPQRFFFNYCTYGYTMPFWDWNDWERMIDWMALNGINMPLAITGQESVWYNVWTKLGMTDEEVRGYFTGPVYLPWHRMANIDGWCGPLPKEWLEGQTKLQQQILARERALNMRPVLPGFAGHVPGKLRSLFPNADIKPLSTWDEFEPQYRTFFLNSEDPLYAKIQKLFIEEQTKLFGTDHIYGIDPFNEMDPPSFEPEYLNKVSKHIYESLKAVDPKAEWMQMGWFLYYQRKDYTPERAKAMLTGVPKGKMTMLDYYCEFKEMWRDLDGFFGQPYIWCYLGNFGGNSPIQGNVKVAGEKLEAALKEGGKNLVGIGSTLEGLEVQQMPYEYIFDKAWNLQQTDAQFVSQLAARHAGNKNESAHKAWQILFNEVLNIKPSTFVGPLPVSYPILGEEYKRAAIKYNPETLYRAWSLLLDQPSVSTDAMTIDLVWTGRQLIGDLFNYEKQQFDRAMQQHDIAAMRLRATIMQEILHDLDVLNAAQPFCTIGKWIEQARDLGQAPEVKDYYEMNARRLITTWGGDLNDYACRNWSGLMGTYYAKRWQFYIDEAFRSVSAGEEFNDKARREKTSELQNAFAVSTEPVPQPTCYDVLGFSQMLQKKYADELTTFCNWHKQQQLHQ